MTEGTRLPVAGERAPLAGLRRGLPVQTRVPEAWAVTNEPDAVRDGDERSTVGRPDLPGEGSRLR